jgi:CDP-glycerol glycerophosphotransferase (TagB/SpsB family)
MKGRVTVWWLLFDVIIGLPVNLLSYFMPKQKNLWVFGSWFGMRYSDNTRILYEYCKNDSGLRPVWVTRSPKVYADLREKGDEVYLLPSWRGYWVCMRAGCAFYTCGPDDLSPFFVSGSRKIQLWHGIPLKRILYDDDVRYPATPFGNLRLWIDRTVRFFMPSRRQAWDYVVSSSPEVSRRLKSAFRVSESRLIETGYPRADRILGLASPAAQGRKVILYAPTHRHEGRGPFQATDFLRGLDLDALNGLMRDSGYVFKIKLHNYHSSEPLRDLLAGFEFVELVDGSVDIYDVLPAVDLLITDYSSIYFDYLVLDRPVFFYCFDLDDYRQNERGMYDDYEKVTPGPRFVTWNDFTPHFLALVSGVDAHAAERHQLLQFFYGDQPAGACARLTSFLRNNGASA